MSNKSKIKAAQKRADRRVASKNKGPRKPRYFAPQQVMPTALEKAVQRNNLPDPFKKIVDGTEAGEVLDNDDAIKKTRKACSDLFRMFSYIAMAKNLDEKGHIKFTPIVDVDDAALRLVQLDKRILRLPALAEGDQEAFAYELIEIASEMDDLASVLYKEIERLEEDALVMEAHLDAAVKSVLADPSYNVDTPEAATIMVLESMAFVHVGKHITVTQ